jgi:hypothetical protein
MRTIIIGAVLLALAGQASAEENASFDPLWSANGIMPGCRSFLTKDASNLSYKTGFLEGRCTGIITGVLFAGMLSGAICVPSKATIHQLVAVVIRHTDQHPQDMHYRFVWFAYRALKEAWPCKPDQADK